MKFLKEVGFSDENIKEAELNIPSLLAEKVIESKDLVKENINFLKELGVINWEQAFMACSELFLRNTVDFQEIFNKYDREDLIKKIEKNVAILEHL